MVLLLNTNRQNGLHRFYFHHWNWNISRSARKKNLFLFLFWADFRRVGREGVRLVRFPNCHKCLIQFLSPFPSAWPNEPCGRTQRKIWLFLGYCRPNQLTEVVVGEPDYTRTHPYSQKSASTRKCTLYSCKSFEGGSKSGLDICDGSLEVW